MERFELIFEGVVNDDVKIQKFRSKKSKLLLVVANVYGPLLSGHFCVATETFNDDGLPHILEHVLFLGSEKYPFKGVLDRIATRCISDGTNAWTDSDHTCYTVTTVGFEGYLNLLPVYLDHILFPILSDAAYTTEVHHINGFGIDGGVVYSEMQSVENTDHAVSEREMLKSLYPGGCGYGYEHGGILKNIRESTNNEKVRAYHASMYRPENLCIIIQGMVNMDQLFNKIVEYENVIYSKLVNNDFKRPWQSSVPVLVDSIVKEIAFPSDEEDEGIVLIAWRGPNVNNHYVVNACKVMLTYLTDSPVSLLSQHFVEVDDPFCGEIGHSFIENRETSFLFEFTSVNIEYLNEIKPRLTELLTKLSIRDEKLFDMKRMNAVIHNMILDILNNMEHHVFDLISSAVICDFLYGNNEEDTKSRFNELQILRSLEKLDEEFWLKLLDNYIIDKPCVTVIGRPSREEVKKNEKDEELRMTKRLELIGTDNLKKLQMELDASVSENNKPIPEYILSNVKIPSLTSLKYHSVVTYHNKQDYDVLGANLKNNDINKIPCIFQMDDITTAFVTIDVFFNGCWLNESLVPYLPLFIETFFESPIIRNSVEVPYEAVVKKLNEDLIEHSSSLGLHGDRFECGEFSSIVNISVKVEISKFEKGVRWLGEIISGLVLNEARITSISKKMKSDIALKKRDADVVIQSLNTTTTFIKQSVLHSSSILCQQSFLRDFHQKKNLPQHLDNLNKIKESIFRLENLYIHMTADVDMLNKSLGIGKSIYSVWNKEFISLFYSKRITTATTNSLTKWTSTFDSSFVEPQLFHIKSSIVGIGSTDSSYLIRSCLCPKDFDNQDIPALLVFCNFITELEGPMWKLIRGKGLAYSFSLIPDINEGLMQLSITRSSDLFEAFHQTYLLIESLVKNHISISQLELENARCKCMFDITRSISTPSLLSKQMLVCCLRGVPLSYNKLLLEKIEKVTVIDLNNVVQKYVSQLIDPLNSRMVIICPPKEIMKLVSKFQTLLNCNFDVYKNINAFNTE